MFLGFVCWVNVSMVHVREYVDVCVYVHMHMEACLHAHCLCLLLSTLFPLRHGLSLNRELTILTRLDSQ